MSLLTFIFALTLSYVVETKLGWQLSLLAGVAVIVGIFSLGAGSVSAFTKKSMKFTFVWGFLAMALFVSFLMVSTQTLPP